MITGRVFEEEGNWYVQDAGDVLETAGTNPVRAFFVFLDLLEGDAEALPQFLLAHTKHGTTKTNPASYMDVDRVRLLLVFNHHSVLTFGSLRTASRLPPACGDRNAYHF